MTDTAPTPSPASATSGRLGRAAVVAGVMLASLALLVLRSGGLVFPGAAVVALAALEAMAGLRPRAGRWWNLQRWLDVCGGRLAVSPSQVLLVLNGLLASLLARAAAGDGAQVLNPLATPLWLVGIALVLAGTWTTEAAPHKPPRVTWEAAALLALTLTGLILRAWGAGHSPYVLSGDEGSAGLTGWEFRSGSRDNLLSLGWFSFPALYFWLLSLSQGLFGRTAEAIRWVSALAGAATVPALYWMARRMFGRPAALGAAAWLAAFHVHLFFSRLAYNNIFDGLFLVLAAGGLWIGWTERNRGAFLVAGAALGFSQFFYTTSHLTPLLLAVWLVLLARRWQADAARRAGLAAAVLVALAVILPLALLYLAHPHELTFTASRVSMLVPGWTGEAATALGTTTVGLLLEQIWVTAIGLVVGQMQGIYYGSGVPMLFSMSAALFFGGLGLCLVRLRDARYSLPLLTLLATVLVGGLSIQAPNSQRMLFVSPMLALMVVLPIDEACRWADSHWPRLGRVWLVSFVVVVGVMVGENVRQLFLRYLPNEEYGSLNGAVAMAMVELLPDLPASTQTYFVGGDRMSFNSIPSLPYLLPDATAIDLTSIDDLPTDSTSSSASLAFILLPEQDPALHALESRFPGAVSLRRYNPGGDLLFTVLAVGDAARALDTTSP